MQLPCPHVVVIEFAAQFQVFCFALLAADTSLCVFTMKLRFLVANDAVSIFASIECHLADDFRNIHTYKAFIGFVAIEGCPCHLAQSFILGNLSLDFSEFPLGVDVHLLVDVKAVGEVRIEQDRIVGWRLV